LIKIWPFAFKAGDRFQFSELGRRRNPRLRDRVGTVLTVGGKVSSTDSLLVLLDNSASPLRLHRTYVEPLDRDDS
jgi:hypothetical protein